MEYVESAVFVFDEAGAEWEQQVSDNPFGTRITAVRAEGFLEAPERFAPPGSHVVLCAVMAVVEPVVRFALEHDVSLGFLPQEGQKLMLRNFHLSKRFDENLEVALRHAAEAVDVTRCNDRIMLFKAAAGRVPLLESRDGGGWRWHGPF